MSLGEVWLSTLPQNPLFPIILFMTTSHIYITSLSLESIEVFKFCILPPTFLTVLDTSAY